MGTVGSRESPRPLSRPAATVLLHVTVLLWGFTAILGHAISIHAVPLVWYRVGLVIVTDRVEKYVPPKKGSPAGVRNTVSGQPPLRPMSWTTSW